MAKPSHAAVLAWSRLLRAHGVALGAVERALKSKGMPPLAWYDVLLELERAGPLRPRDLQGRLLLAQYNLSRLLDRMAVAAVIEQRACEEDRRGLLVSTNAAGRRLRRRMWPVYARAIAAAIDDRLNGAEAEALAALLGRLYGSPQPSGETSRARRAPGSGARSAAKSAEPRS